MNITVENLPILFLMIVGIGVIIVVIGVLRLASSQELSDDYYINANSQNDTAQLQELFSYFLEEEEKKNNAFREMIRDTSKEKDSQKPTKKEVPVAERVLFEEIIKMHEQGKDAQSIAKILNRGIGEVNLIISLYAKR